jgi:hypothetical protein
MWRRSENCICCIDKKGGGGGIENSVVAEGVTEPQGGCRCIGFFNPASITDAFSDLYNKFRNEGKNKEEEWKRRMIDAPERRFVAKSFFFYNQISFSCNQIFFITKSFL